MAKAPQTAERLTKALDVTEAFVALYWAKWLFIRLR